MAAPKKRRPALRDAGNGHRNIASKPAPAVGINIETGHRFDIEIERVDLIDIIDELRLIRANTTAAFLTFRCPIFLNSDPAHKAALSELLENLEVRTAALYERLKKDLAERRGAA